MRSLCQQILSEIAKSVRPRFPPSWATASQAKQQYTPRVCISALARDAVSSLNPYHRSIDKSRPLHRKWRRRALLLLPPSPSLPLPIHARPPGTTSPSDTPSSASLPPKTAAAAVAPNPPPDLLRCAPLRAPTLRPGSSPGGKSPSPSGSWTGL